MTVEALRNLFLWCSILDYGLLIVWAVFLFLLPHQWFYRWAGLFHISKEELDRANLPLLGFFKLLVLVFNLIPYIALRIIS